MVKNGILGIAIGDMLGVPVEFTSRSERDFDPVTGVREGGKNGQPRGAWSDDTSMTLCLASALTSGTIELPRIAEEFLDWQLKAKWTSHGYVFDIGAQTFMALSDIRRIIESGDLESLDYLRNEAEEHTNGNGSLMRTLPLYFALREKGVEENFETIWKVSALTHGHIRSALACLIYLVMIDELLKNDSLTASYHAMQQRMQKFFFDMHVPQDEQKVFERIIDQDISTLDRQQVFGTGYVVHTLEASLWSFLTTNSFESAVLRVVNLGDDADTNGAVTGGLAGIFYGIDSAPSDWLDALSQKSEIEDLCSTFSNVWVKG